MPTVEENSQKWNAAYGWHDQGEVWSAPWGGSAAQWFGAILPRIHAFLPATTILEIAPGFGRWTTHLKDSCEHLIVVDLAENCIEACRRRFADESHITYHVNDGKSLAMVPDRSIDFAFSFDSLVHAEADVMRAYLEQLAAKLKPNGVGFLHHSNIGAYRRSFSLSRRIPSVLRDRLIQGRIIDQTHWRAFSMTASLFAGFCEQAGLQCVSQEMVNWATKRLIDCFSVFTPKSSTWARPNVVVENPGFMREAAMIRRLSRLYGVPGLPSTGQGPLN
jgi:2-polyprenyl-3-methyl-5-hydroxy-6-metoxy-1,4-benzoquinol methylase